eukprot:CAMPEP_0175163370 /NCGR_PEP_ID=MMETSP0087-20121206/25718_1 /TAXON_ID=136419 /ORGANISM="Unknown Unknown, Strain D1" /LENGTH=39 /DNA_ID= /DNA_START= /DNA_END= /DNA_ORIENTATION=
MKQKGQVSGSNRPLNKQEVEMSVPAATGEEKREMLRLAC